MQLAIRRQAVRSSARSSTFSRPYGSATETASNSKNKKSKALKAERVFSGIQPTGVPHLGNYLGALRQWKDFQDEKIKLGPNSGKGNALSFSIVDLHALTGKQTREERQRLRKESFVSLLAVGLDPKYSTIFVQSEVPAHSELMWILSTVASTGYLSRMTQWKSKLELSDDATLSDDDATAKLKLGLFSYPVLQAADILIHRATIVPVGEDQSQHVEFARQLARSFQAHFCESEPSPFPVPRTQISPAKRIMSLRDPTSKMSKSHPDPKSRILITDSAEEIQSKLKGAVTDSEDGISYDPERRPGVSNLVEILKHVTRTEASCEDIAKDNQTLSKGAFKSLVAQKIITALEGFRDRFDELMKPGNQEFANAVVHGRHMARGDAGKTILDVKKILGFDRLDEKPEKTSVLDESIKIEQAETV